MKGDNLVSSDNQTLKSLKASSSKQLDVYTSGQTESPEAWRADLDKKIKKVMRLKVFMGAVHGTDEARVYAELCETVEEWIEQLHKDGVEVSGPLAGEKGI
jgi:hypothetical protein